MRGADEHRAGLLDSYDGIGVADGGGCFEPRTRTGDHRVTFDIEETFRGERHADERRRRPCFQRSGAHAAYTPMTPSAPSIASARRSTIVSICSLDVMKGGAIST
ncbi:hypothetical protein LMG28727_05594 [Paraburkholderia kirstenboschensis]|nr:hypothetical protein LMG28727_05594 [Paraburkholderia kirstenboschensis]